MCINVDFVCFPEPVCRCSLPEKTAFLEKTPGLMSGPTDLGNGSILEPVLRLRKGYMPDVAGQKHDDHNQSSDQGPLLVEPPISSEQEKYLKFTVYGVRLADGTGFEIFSICKLAAKQIGYQLKSC
ncbi:UNVERIFIED_CONTAM: hypothetical protein K2H54_075108 [Gekko kuhli]